MDGYSEEWRRKIDEWNKLNIPTVPYQPIITFPLPVPVPQLTQEELDQFRRMLERAKQYDIDHNEPNCELEEKKERLRKLAEELGAKVEFL